LSKTQFCEAMAPMRVHLMDRPFVNGSAPAYGDFSVFGTLRWVDLVDAFDILEEDDPISEWYARMRIYMGIE